MKKKLFGGSSKGRFAVNIADVSLSDDEQEQEQQELPVHVLSSQRGKHLRQKPAKEQPVPEKMQENNPEEKSAGKNSIRKRFWLKVAAIVLAIVLFLEVVYCVVIFTDLIPPFAKLRGAYIETAMSTMSHQWLAKGLIPGDIVQNVVLRMDQAKANQAGVQSGWGDVAGATEETRSPSAGFSKDAAASILGQLAQDHGMSSGENAFFEMFHELDEESTRAYAQTHPEVIADGWNHFLVNEAGLDDHGTDIYTKQGDQVLAVDAANGLMVIRITGSSYRGVLVLGKDPSRLKCAPSAHLGTVGQAVGEIAQGSNGLVAMTGSGFDDHADAAEGAILSGGTMFSGYSYGTHYPWGYKRVELHRDNRLYIMDAHVDYSPNCTDATEWTPALIVDGVDVAGRDDLYTALNPRTCIGQTRDETIMFLGIEGRRLDSLGCNAQECAKILARYGGYQAMNVDGGSSSMIWYQGEYIMRSANAAVPEGRRLPNAWIYCADPVEDPPAGKTE